MIVKSEIFFKSCNINVAIVKFSSTTVIVDDWAHAGEAPDV